MPDEGLQEFFHYASKLRIAGADDWKGAGFEIEPNGNPFAVHLNERLHYQHAYIEQSLGIRILLDRIPVTEGSVYSGKKTQDFYSRKMRYYTQGMRWSVSVDAKEEAKKVLIESTPILMDACKRIASYRLQMNQPKPSSRGKSTRQQPAKG